MVLVFLGVGWIRTLQRGYGLWVDDRPAFNRSDGVWLFVCDISKGRDIRIVCCPCSVGLVI